MYWIYLIVPYKVSKSKLINTNRNHLLCSNYEIRCPTQYSRIPCYPFKSVWKQKLSIYPNRPFKYPQETLTQTCSSFHAYSAQKKKKRQIWRESQAKTGRVQGMWWQEEKCTRWFEVSSERTGRRITIESEGSWKIRGSRLKSRLNMISFSFSFRLAYESRRYSALCAIWIKARADAYLLGIPILQLSVSRASSPCSPSAPFPPHPVHHGRCRVGCGHTYAREID